MDRINIRDLEIFARHGVFPEENVLGQKFVISAGLHLSTCGAAEEDDLDRSVNYGEVCTCIKEYTEKYTFRLIETLAEGLARTILLEFPLVRAVDIEVKKPWAPISLPLEEVSIEISRKRHRAFVALGSNMGDRKAHLEDAVRKMDDLPGCRVVRCATPIETEPYGGVEQDDFLNSCVELETLFTPHELLRHLAEIEADAGRVRTVRWGPRTLDLDIILYDEEIVETPDLTVPHIEMHKRGFVLIPLAEIAPYAVHPAMKKTVIELLEMIKKESL